MSEYPMTIDGARATATRTFPVINPATGEAFAEAPDATREQLDAALSAAERAQPAWAADEAARRSALARAAEALQARVDAIARTFTLEQGRPLSQAQGEVQGAAANLAAMAKLPLPGEVLRDDGRGHLAIAYRPYGVAAGITPWNFPILIAMSKIAPALLAGNTMVLKPSPFTPLATLQLSAVLAEHLPAGVLSVVSGGNELGAWLTADPRVKKISFTGSVATGKKIAATAGAELKRLTLELGGNDAAIVLDDADLDAVIPPLFWSAFFNCGQVCIAVKRLYVPEALVPAVVERLVAEARAAVVGDGLDPASQIGPINNAPQLERVASLVDRARAAGGTVHCGGARLDRPGYFYAPTIVSGLGDDAPLVAEEQFGPVLPVLGYRTEDEAVRRANATAYGLGASVWGKDGARARALGRQLQAGTIWINQHAQLSGKVPFAGAKDSGLGYAGGRYGLEAFMQRYVINQQGS